MSRSAGTWLIFNRKKQSTPENRAGTLCGIPRSPNLTIFFENSTKSLFFSALGHFFKKDLENIFFGVFLSYI
tara:strand:- start:687 stop:902 length:216 start_codon:yes stop_codon:yes gene_type:complete